MPAHLRGIGERCTIDFIWVGVYSLAQYVECHVVVAVWLPYPDAA